MRLFDHLDLRVRNRKSAETFYDVLMPALGFPVKGTSGHCVYYEAVSGHPKPEFVALIEEPNHLANHSRIAFWAESARQLDALGELLARAGAKNIEGPLFCPEYSPTYYAVFFEDPSGNRFEVACRVAKPEMPAGERGD